MKLSVIVPSLEGKVPESLRQQTEGRDDVELVVVEGIRPVGKARNMGLDRACGDKCGWHERDGADQAPDECDDRADGKGQVRHRGGRP